MAVERVGNAYLGDLWSTSVSITVPSDATIAIAFGKHYETPTGAPIIGSSSFQLIVRKGSYPIVDAWYLINPPTGAQTLYYRPADGFPDSYHFGIAFYKGVNTSSPIQSYGSSINSTDITGLTYSSGTIMVGAAAGGYNIPTVTDNSQTQLLLESQLHGFGVAQRADVGDFYFSGTNLVAVAVILALQQTASLIYKSPASYFSSLLVR